jgi:23S rRNA pseudouridine1911/1915/1917 synthase
MNKVAKKREQKAYLENKGKRPQKMNLKEYPVTKRIELLEFLLETLKGVSRNNVKAILSHHCVSIHGAPVTQFNYVLYPGDTVIISKTPFKTQKEGKFSLEILYEDNEFIAINKPQGLLSVSSDKEKTRTAYKLVLDYLIKKDKHNHLFVVHRIDRETSGVLMFCKNERIRDIMQDKWNDIVTKRGYFAVVDGQVKDKEGTVKSWLKMNKENLMYVSKTKKDAQFCVTHYKVLKQNDTHTLLDVNIDSGRKNQIRVQLGSIGHNVIGDDKYGEPSDPINRLGLHAYSLIFKHPITGKEYKFETRMPKSFLSMF